MNATGKIFGDSQRIIKIARSVILFILIIFIASLYYFHDYKNQILFIDEHEFLRKSYYFDLLFVKHDLKDTRWYSEQNDEGAAQPKVGPYIYGLALHLSGIKDIEKTFQTIGFNSIKINGESWWKSLWMQKPSTFPSTLNSSMKIIWIGRVTGIIFTIGTIGILFIIGSTLLDPVYGFIGALLFTFNHLFSVEGKFAMTDSIQLFFFFLNLLLSIHWISEIHARNTVKIIMYSLFIGLCVALGLGTKVSALMLPLFLCFYIFLVLLIERSYHRNLLQVLSGAVIIGITSIVVFYVLHPFIHPNPIYNSWYIFHSRLEGASAYYWSLFPSSAIHTRQSALNIIFARTLASNGSYTNFRNQNYPIDLLLFAVGLFLMIRDAAKSIFTTHKVGSKSLFPLWTFVVFGSLIYYLMNDWSRYYLPLVSCVTFVEAYAISTVINFAWNYTLKFINNRD